VRRSIAAAAAFAALVLAAGCGQGQTDDVDAYLKRANDVQRQAKPAFDDANRAYADFAAGGKAIHAAPERLVRAEKAIRATRRDLAALEPPQQAQPLHAKLLRVYDLNADLARETTQLVSYPRESAAALEPLAAAQRRLSRRLGTASAADAQAAALADYAGVVDGIVGDLRALDPPPLLTAAHDSQVRRLRSAGSLAQRLRRAVGRKDAPEVARLLLLFRRVLAARGADSLPQDSVAEYNRRLQAITLAQADVRREQVRLEDSLR
jgi:hypothetical protein